MYLSPAPTLPRHEPSSIISLRCQSNKESPCLLLGSCKPQSIAMDNQPNHTRPPFDQALKAWRQFLTKQGFPVELIWVFDENLCFEKDSSAQGGFRLGFQTA